MRARRIGGTAERRARAIQVERQVDAPVHVFGEQLPGRRTALQVRHRHDGKLQALRGVDGHDAHEVAVSRRKRPRALLQALQEGAVASRQLRRPVSARGLLLRQDPQRLQHGAGARQALGALGLQARQPSRIKRHAAHEPRRRQDRRIAQCIRHDAHRACEPLRKRAGGLRRRRFLLAGKLAQALVDAAPM